MKGTTDLYADRDIREHPDEHLRSLNGLDLLSNGVLGGQELLLCNTSTVFLYPDAPLAERESRALRRPANRHWELALVTLQPFDLPRKEL